MNQPELLIVGAGPAGLTAAYQAVKHRWQPLVLEASEHVGGISRTEEWQGFRFDIGGHRFFTKEEVINELWHEVLGDDFIRVSRLSRIFYRGQFFAYPLAPLDALRKLGFGEACRIGLSYLGAQARPKGHERSFEEWVSNRFGDRLYRTFFKTYTEKVWGMPCSEISADWAAQRIKGMSLTKAVFDAFSTKPQAKSLIREFEYPRLGPGMMWERFREKVKAGGGEVRMQVPITRVRHADNVITSVESADGEIWQPEHLISSMPLRTLLRQLDPPPPAEVMVAANRLRYRDFLVVALFVDEAEIFPDNWIYIHEPGVQVGRVQNFKNWSPEMVPNPKVTGLGMEYFCHEGDGLWESSDEDLIALATDEAAKIGLAEPTKVFGGRVIRQPKAYPVYDHAYQENLAIIERYLSGWQNLQTIGRNGLHRYNNQDHSMLTAIRAVDNLQHRQHDLWQINTERSYHETFTVGDSDKRAAG
ncbi:MAG: NAD(P)/FAD-dependent oxidoreductase [Opitutales bacterium]